MNSMNESINLLKKEINPADTDIPRELARQNEIVDNVLQIKYSYVQAIGDATPLEQAFQIRGKIAQCDLVIIEINSRKFTNSSIYELISKIEAL